MDKLFSIIIVNWNGKKWLKKCLDSLYSQTYKSFEVIVVDNDSIDDSVKFLEKNYRTIKILHSENKGFGHGANIGAEAARGVFLMFFNEDMYVEDDFLERYLLEYNKIRQKKSVGTIGCAIANYDKSLPLSVKTYGLSIDLMSAPTLNFDPNNIFHNTGCPFLIQRKTFEHAGGFCENIFLYSEDIDLCWRLNLLGYKHYFLPDICIYHYGGGVIGDFSTKKLSFYIKGEINCMFNNYSCLLLPFAFIYFSFFYFCLSILYLLLGKFKYTKTIIITILGELRYNIKSILIFRKSVQSKRTVSDWRLLGKINLIPSRLKNFYYIYSYKVK